MILRSEADTDTCTAIEYHGLIIEPVQCLRSRNGRWLPNQAKLRSFTFWRARRGCQAAVAASITEAVRVLVGEYGVWCTNDHQAHVDNQADGLFCEEWVSLEVGRVIGYPSMPFFEVECGGAKFNGPRKAHGVDWATSERKPKPLGGIG